MKRFLIIGLLTLSVMSLFANGGQETEQDGVNLSVAVMGNFLGDQMDGLISEFEARYPGSTVTDVHRISSNDWSDYLTKVRTLIAGGDSPDVIYVAIEGVKYLAAKKMAIPMDAYIDSNPEVKASIDDIHPKLQSSFEIDGKTYGTVFGWNNIVTHFNLDIMEKVGLDVPSEDWTKEEFLQYADALTSEADGIKTFGVAIPDFYFSVSAWLYNFGAAFLNDDMTASALDTPEALAAFQLLYDLVYKYEYSPQPFVEGADNVINSFINDQVAMVFLGRWPLPSWIENDMNFDIQYMPNFGAQQVIFGSGAWVIGSESKNPEEAFELAIFLNSEYAQKTAIEVSAIPARISVMEEVLPNSPPRNTMLFKESADIAKAVQSPEEYPEIAQVFQRYFSSMMANELPVKDAVDGMHKEFNEILSR